MTIATYPDLIEHLRRCRSRGRRVYIIGNGGSYANAAHIANDLLACAIRAFTFDAASLSAFANDYGWEAALGLWIEVVAETGDVLIALSGSGTSKNILVAVELAHRKGVYVWTEFGGPRGIGMQLAEEQQIQLGHHLLMDLRVQ